MNAAAIALRQIERGADFSAPSAVLKISSAMASASIPGAGYTIAEYVAHADLWNGIWLARILGEPRPKMHPHRFDWPEAPAHDWNTIRTSFLNRLKDAGSVANRDNLTDAEMDLLMRIALHSSYHLGQIVLLKRQARAMGRIGR